MKKEPKEHKVELPKHLEIDKLLIPSKAPDSKPEKPVKVKNNA